MRRWYTVGVLALVLLGGIAVGVGAYNVGLKEGLERTGQATEIVRYVGPGFGGFPFGLILFPLFFFGIFALMRGAMWRRHGDGHRHGPGPWGGPGGRGPWSDRAQEWHRLQHEGAKPASAGGEPA